MDGLFDCSIPLNASITCARQLPEFATIDFFLKKRNRLKDSILWELESLTGKDAKCRISLPMKEFARLDGLSPTCNLYECILALKLQYWLSNMHN